MKKQFCFTKMISQLVGGDFEDFHEGFNVT